MYNLVSPKDAYCNNTTSPRSKRFISCYYHKPEQRLFLLQFFEQQSVGASHGAFLLSKHDPCGARVTGGRVGDGVVGPGGVVEPFSFGRQVLVEGFPPEQSPEQQSSPLRHPSPSFFKLHSTGGGVGLRLGVLDGLEVIGLLLGALEGDTVGSRVGLSDRVGEGWKVKRDVIYELEFRRYNLEE